MTSIRQRQRETKLTLQPTCLWPFLVDLAFSRRHDSTTFWYINYSFRIAGGILVVTIAMSMISASLVRINRTSKKNQKPRYVKHWCGAIGVAVDGGARGDQFSIVWGTRYHSISYLFGFFVALHCSLYVAGDCFAWHRGWYDFTPDRHQRDYAYYGAIADGVGIEFIVTGIKGIFPGLLN